MEYPKTASHCEHCGSSPPRLSSFNNHLCFYCNSPQTQVVPDDFIETFTQKLSFSNNVANEGPRRQSPAPVVESNSAQTGMNYSVSQHYNHSAHLVNAATTPLPSNKVSDMVSPERVSAPKSRVSSDLRLRSELAQFEQGNDEQRSRLLGSWRSASPDYIGNEGLELIDRLRESHTLTEEQEEELFWLKQRRLKQKHLEQDQTRCSKVFQNYMQRPLSPQPSIPQASSSWYQQPEAQVLVPVSPYPVVAMSPMSTYPLVPMSTYPPSPGFMMPVNPPSPGFMMPVNPPSPGVMVPMAPPSPSFLVPINYVFNPTLVSTHNVYPGYPGWQPNPQYVEHQYGMYDQMNH